MAPHAVQNVAVVGTGVIGSGWAAIFAAKGYSVTAYVRSATSEEKFLRFLQAAWRKIEARGLASDPDGWKRVAMVRSIAECVGKADYIQESVVEELKLKQEIVKEIDACAPPGVLIGTSSSFIPLSLVRYAASLHPERVATAHPTLPAWDSFVEVLGSSVAHTAWLSTFFGPEGVGMDVVSMRKENHGHVLNACINALTVTSMRLIHSGICSAADLDRSVVHLARVVVASGGLTGGLVGMVGDGSPDAQADLSVDICIGAPVAMSACVITWWCPSFLSPLALCFVQRFRVFTSWRLLKAAVRWFITWFCGPMHRRWKGEIQPGWEGRALSRMRALEKLDLE